MMSIVPFHNLSEHSPKDLNHSLGEKTLLRNCPAMLMSALLYQSYNSLNQYQLHDHPSNYKLGHLKIFLFLENISVHYIPLQKPHGRHPCQKINRCGSIDLFCLSYS